MCKARGFGGKYNGGVIRLGQFYSLFSGPNHDMDALLFFRRP